MSIILTQNQYRSNGYLVTQAYPGIYYVEKEGMFPIQIIVGSQLNRKNHLWLKSLSQKMTETDVKKLVLQVSIKENQALFDRMKEEGDVVVSNVLMEFMKPEIDAVVKEAVDNATREVAKEATRQTASRLFNQGVSYEICRATIDSDVISDEELQAIYNNTQ